jgi:hypothetical protein
MTVHGLTGARASHRPVAAEAPRREHARSPVAAPLSSSVVVSVLLSTVISMGFLATSPRFAHWFIIPVTVCGILIGIDAAAWLFGRIDVFDPVGIIGLLGFHVFFLAPLLHVSWDHWMAYVVGPADWRPWLGWMAALNAIGLLCYRFTRRVLSSRRSQSARTEWRTVSGRFSIAVTAALLATAVLQVWVYAQHGGVLAYIDHATSTERFDEASSFAGTGWILTMSESFPILAMIAFAAYSRDHPHARRWAVLAPALVVFVALQLLFGGLRGSRSNTIWSLFWAVGIVHLWIRPLRRGTICVGLVGTLLFMYLYGFFKDMGLDAFRAFESGSAREELEGRTQRKFETLILDDLGRSDVQAFVLSRLMESDRDYGYALGRTYLGTLALLIPASVWPDRPPTKVQEGTEVQYGDGTYLPYGQNKLVSLRVYGLAGETMLNFGPVAIPIAFVVFGCIVEWTRRRTLAWSSRDSRQLLVPFLVNLCFLVLISDSDNILFFVIKSGFAPLALVLLTSQISEVRHHAPRAGNPPGRRSLRPLGVRPSFEAW